MSSEKEQQLHGFGEWITFVTELASGDERFWNQSVAAGKWTIREVVAHILRWDDYFYNEAIAKACAGLPLTVKHLDYDAFNEDARAYGKNTPIAELAGQAAQSRNRIIEAIAELTNMQYEAVYEDADGHPFRMAQYMNDFIWHDRHHIEPIRKLKHFRLEEMSLNGWPALQTDVYDGWLLRFAEGYTKRSNSISPLYGHMLELDAKIRACEERYKRQGIRTVFKITPFSQPATLDEELASRGYELIDRSIVKTVRLATVRTPSHAEIRLENEPADFWLDAVSRFSGLSEKQIATTRKMLEQIAHEKCFAILQSNGLPVACGFAVIEDGWIGLYDIVTDPDNRNKGYGEQLILHLLQWGKELGATDGYLLVMKNNAPANRLYDKIGYEPQYEYWYRAR